jgi:hypothetical protein
LALGVSGREADESTLREPPWSSEAEQSVLGSLLQDSSVMALVADLLTPASFYAWEHREIFAAVQALLQDRHPVDAITVWERLGKAPQGEQTLNLSLINALEVCVPSARNVRRYAEIVAERAAERDLIAASDESVRISWDEKLTLEDRAERISSVYAKVEQRRKNPGGARVPLLKLAALREASARIRWLVKHVVPADAVGMFFGGSGTFKSFIALDAALHVVHGLPWMGRKTAQGSVVYIAAEGGAGLWSRIDAWHRARNLSWKDAPLYVVPAAIDLTMDAWRVVDAVQMLGVEPLMVVVDTLSQTYSGEENSANEMAAYLRELGGRFRQLWGCAVALVHHSGHQATERPRGSSAIRANLDFLLAVHRDEKEMLATVTCIKQKDGELFEDATFSLTVSELGLDEDGDRITSLVAWHLSTEDEIMRAQQGEQAAGRGGRQHLLMSLVQQGMEEKALRKAFYDELGVADPDVRKKAFYRARDAAIRQHQIEVCEGVVIDLRGRK